LAELLIVHAGARGLQVKEYSLGIRRDYVIHLRFLWLYLWSFLFLLKNFFLKRYCSWCMFGFMLDYLKLHWISILCLVNFLMFGFMMRNLLWLGPELFLNWSFRWFYGEFEVNFRWLLNFMVLWSRIDSAS